MEHLDTMIIVINVKLEVLTKEASCNRCYAVKEILGHLQNFFYFFKRFYLFIFRQRGREGEREGEKYQCVVVSHMLLTGDLTCNPGMCPDWELNS